MLRVLLTAVATFLLATTAAGQNFTPDEYHVTFHGVELSTDGVNFVTVLSDEEGIDVDLADPASFAGVFSDAVAIPSGTYDFIRVTIDRDLVWSHPGAPVMLSDQVFTVSDGPPGPSPDQLTVYFATFDKGGRPNGVGGGDGTVANPFLLGQGAQIAAGRNTTLRIVFVVTNTLVDQGGGMYDLAPPELFFVSENESAASLAGTYNTALYNAVKDHDGMGTTTSWEYTSGSGVLIFDGSGGWTWSGTTNDFDLLGGATGALDSGAVVTGRYGVNEDGSFWMLATGEPGTLRGAVSADGTTIVATMYDSRTSHLMIFGVEQASTADVSSIDGGFYFTTYGNDYDSGSTSLRYGSSFGIVTGDGTGAISGTSDSNEVSVADPTGSPSSSGPVSASSAFSDTLLVTTNGVVTNTDGTLRGGMLQNGSAACISFDFDASYSAENKFGFIVRQSAAGTFTDASLVGTYFGACFGDTYDQGQGTSEYFSGFFSLDFDGAGAATVTLLENREGAIVSETFNTQYSVNTNTGIVTFSEPQGGEADIQGAIGPGARSFILTAKTEVGGQANDQRFLGLGLVQ